MSTSTKPSKTNKNRTQKNFVDSIVTSLVRLDKQLAPKAGPVSNEDNNISVKQLREMYRDFVVRFIEIGELESSVLVHSVALAKKVVKVAKTDYTFKKGEFVLLYSACLYLSIKMLIDEERWFLADFSYVSNLEESHIEKMEQFVLIDILNFDPKVSEEDFKKERLALRTVSAPKKRLTIM